jgi:cellulose synthase/poly-beta-1,6-N-acetylglucosamine synthase-like glycosyltransferase
MNFCVLIPAKDERLGIGKTIQSVLDAGAAVTDIYVIDDGSSDGTAEIAESFGVNVLRNEKNISKAMSIRRLTIHFDLTNRYDVICLMDADTEVSRNYFEVVLNGMADPNIGAVCGRAKSVPHNWLTAYRAFQYWISHAIYKGGQNSMKVITVAPGCASSYRAASFAQLDWNRDTIVEDMDCTIQTHRKQLGGLKYVSEAVVYTQDPATVRDYCKQMYRWQTGAWQIGMKYRMITGLSRVDWEYKLLMGEGIVFAIFFMLLPLWLLLYPKLIAAALLCDFGLLVILAAICSVCDRRVDVLLYIPRYLPMRFIDCAVFLYTFWKTFLQRQHVDGWFAVKRY